MRYLGGKSKTRKQISSFLERVRKPNQTYFEPFVGGAWILQEMGGKRIASDGNRALIAMYKALQNGWVPPERMTEEEYQVLKRDKDPYNGCELSLVLAVLLVVSGLVALSEMVNKARAKCSVKASANSILKQLPKIKDVQFLYGEYQDHLPCEYLVYCDPPYQGTTQYGAFSGFDHLLFWNKMREWSKSNTVVISEYNAPEDFKCVWEKETTMCMYDKTGKQQIRKEKLFMYNGI